MSLLTRVFELSVVRHMRWYNDLPSVLCGTESYPAQGRPRCRVLVGGSVALLLEGGYAEDDLEGGAVDDDVPDGGEVEV